MVNTVHPESNRKKIERRAARADDSTAAAPPPAGAAAAQPSAPVTARGPQSGFTPTAQLVQRLVQRAGPDPDPSPNGNGNGNGHSPRRRALGPTRPTVVAPVAPPASTDALRDRMAQHLAIAHDTLTAVGVYAHPSALEADFIARAEHLGVELGAVDVMAMLWKAKRERLAQARRAVS
jgi:hypothetical protein